jgi:transcriptional regulator with XRE-family HTH domain
LGVVTRILELNEERNWSEYRLAKEAGISQSTISNLIHRGNSPSVSTLEKMCDAFGITLAQFFDTEDEVTALTAGQRKLIGSWNRLTPRQKEKAEMFILGMLEK